MLSDFEWDIFRRSNLDGLKSESLTIQFIGPNCLGLLLTSQVKFHSSFVAKKIKRYTIYQATFCSSLLSVCDGVCVCVWVCGCVGWWLGGCGWVWVGVGGCREGVGVCGWVWVREGERQTKEK